VTATEVEAGVYVDTDPDVPCASTKYGSCSLPAEMGARLTTCGHGITLCAAHTARVLAMTAEGVLWICPTCSARDNEMTSWRRL
jgi:hypothetical protein